jgi:hypothetical protein
MRPAPNAGKVKSSAMAREAKAQMRILDLLSEYLITNG